MIIYLSLFPVNIAEPWYKIHQTKLLMCLAHWVRRSFSTKVRHFIEIVIEHEKNVFFLFSSLLKNLIRIFNRQINQNLWWTKQQQQQQQISGKHIFLLKFSSLFFFFFMRCKIYYLCLVTPTVNDGWNILQVFIAKLLLMSNYSHMEICWIFILIF